MRNHDYKICLYSWYLDPRKRLVIILNYIKCHKKFSVWFEKLVSIAKQGSGKQHTFCMFTCIYKFSCIRTHGFHCLNFRNYGRHIVLNRSVVVKSDITIAAICLPDSYPASARSRIGTIIDTRAKFRSCGEDRDVTNVV